MALDSTQLQYAGNGEVYVAPVGTAMPTDLATALNVAFIGLGYTTEDGVTLTPSQDVNNIPAWQSLYPVDRRVTSRDLNVNFSLLQVNKESWKLTFGGGTWSTVTGVHKFVPPAPETIDFRAVVVELIDGTNKTRVLIPKVMVSDPGAIQVRRSDPAAIDITLGLVTTGSGDPFNVLSNDAKFATV